jgi:multidrug transporter EmrE-like cation transporter
MDARGATRSGPLKTAHLVLLIAATLAACGQVLFKLGATGRETIRQMVNPQILGGLACYGLGTVAWIFSLSKLPLRVVYPYTAFTFVLVYLAAVFLLGERITVRGGAGVSLVLAGLYLLTGVQES